MKESDILHEVGSYWVMKHKGAYVVMKNGLTPSTSIDDVGYQDLSIAIARANYLAKRDANKTVTI